MAKKKNNNLLILGAVLLLFLFGGNCIQTTPAPLSVTTPTTTSSGGYSSGGGGSGGSETTPSTTDIPAWSFPTFAFPTFTFPTFDFPGFPIVPSGTPESGGASTIDPCVANPNMIGCTSTQTPIISTSRLPLTCSGYNYGTPQSVLHTAIGDRYTSFACTSNLDCENNPPGAYTGRPSSLTCCNGECYGASR